MRKTIVGLVAAVIAILATHAGADVVAKHDPNDVDSFLDLRRVVARHGADPSIIKHKAFTYERWHVRQLAACSSPFIFHFAWDGDEVQRYVRVFVEEGKLVADMHDADTGEVIGRTSVWRPHRRGVGISFPSSWLQDELRSYRWRANATSQMGSRCRPGGYLSLIDSAPNRGWMTHNL